MVQLRVVEWTELRGRRTGGQTDLRLILFEPLCAHCVGLVCTVCDTHTQLCAGIVLQVFSPVNSEKCVKEQSLQRSEVTAAHTDFCESSFSESWAGPLGAVMLNQIHLRVSVLQIFLVVAANFREAGSERSVIYQWHRRRRRFVHYQTLETHTAQDWEAFRIHNHSFLVVANHRRGKQEVDCNAVFFILNEWITAAAGASHKTRIRAHCCLHRRTSSGHELIKI